MILTIILNVIYTILAGLLSLLPTGGDFPAEWVSGIYTIWSAVNAFSFLVPTEMLLTCLGIALAWDVFIFAWHFLHWLMRKIPAINIR